MVGKAFGEIRKTFSFEKGALYSKHFQSLQNFELRHIIYVSV